MSEEATVEEALRCLGLLGQAVALIEAAGRYPDEPATRLDYWTRAVKILREAVYSGDRTIAGLAELVIADVKAKGHKLCGA